MSMRTLGYLCVAILAAGCAQDSTQAAGTFVAAPDGAQPGVDGVGADGSVAGADTGATVQDTTGTAVDSSLTPDTAADVPTVADTTPADTASGVDSTPNMDTGVAAPDTTETPDNIHYEDTGPMDTGPEDAGCTPTCAGLACGDDGCGGSCGSCGAQATCYGGVCIPKVKFCAAGCGSVADCVAPNPPAGFDTDNFACVQGACHYTGCAGNSDCALVNTVKGTGLCKQFDAMKLCVGTCSTPADCAAQSGVAAFDADNYTCQEGTCVYLGCNSTAECTSSYASPAYACNTTLKYPICMLKCSSVADCATPSSPAYDADNYTCKAGYCEYTGCKSDAECTAGGLPGYKCVVP